MDGNSIAMAETRALWCLWLLSLSAAASQVMGASDSSSSSWSSIFQVVGKSWSSSGEENLETGREMTLKNYCESWRLNVEIHNIRDFYAVPDECSNFVGKYMSSAQFKSDVHRTVDEASLFLTNSFSLAGDGLDAWVFDLDDTLLSTEPFYKQHHFGGDAANRTSLEEWMAKSKAPAVTDMVDFFHKLRSRGIAVFVVSWRPEHLRSATVDNLIKEGYHGWTQLILRCEEEHHGSVQKYNSEQRKQLVGRGYRLWGIISSQWSSITGTPKPRRAFKVPNPMYYL
ncbi:hypothetical protein HPP92_020373 [Vanilla planifolia]|uniref:Acid phosphatase 1 n=1 Tax=Vanilla planifolia TaxID=51239 RepID=A0A835Q2P2_VANPL|nr:hypothetical protein HPP92_020373 [Vanilla planifolia]